MTLRQKVVGLLTLTLSLAISTPLAAQRDQTREGFWFSIGLGGGSLGCKDCNDRLSGASGQISLGGTVSQKVLLGVSSNGWVKSESGVTLSMVTTTAAIRFYPSETGGFFLLGGVGVSTVELDLGAFSGTTTGGGGVLGLGYDFRVGNNVSLTPYFNATSGNFDAGSVNSAQLGVSVTVH